MRLIKTLVACAALGALASVPAHAQSMNPPKSNAMQGDKASKMSAPDSGEKHAMSKKDGMGMKDSAATAKAAMKSDKGMKSNKAAGKPMSDDKSNGMAKPKTAKDTGLKKHDGMAKDSAMGMMKRPTA